MSNVNSDTSTARDAILGRIRASKPAGDQPPRPPVPQVWPPADPTTGQMAEQFVESLEAVAGEVVRCQSMDDAKAALAEMVEREGWTSLGIVEKPDCSEVVADLPAETVTTVDENIEPRQMAEFAAGIIAPEHLLADTGSCMIVCPTGEHRLMCYLPPVCIIVAHEEQLVETMPAAWGKVSAASSAKDLTGEYVFITGPSRTADIEKILILGVHGPKRVIVLLVRG